MTETQEITAANLPHQVEESDRLSMLGATRAIGFILMLCALVHLACAFSTIDLGNPAWPLDNSEKWNGIGKIFVISAVLFFIPGPNAVRWGTNPLRLGLRVFLALLSIIYLILAVSLGSASNTRLDQLDAGEKNVMSKRDELFNIMVHQVETSSNRAELDRIITPESLNFTESVSKLPFDEYRTKVAQKLKGLNDATIQSVVTEARQRAAETKTLFICKTLTSTLFGLAFLGIALLAPRGFPAPVPYHEQPA